MSAVHVAHDIPGRLRLRLPAGVAADDIQAAANAERGVITSTWSPRTRSLLVLYDRETGDRDAITAAVAGAAGLETPTSPTTNGHSSTTPTSVPGATLALGMRQMFGELDQRVQRGSRGLVGFAGLVTASLAAWALTELVRGRAAPLAWSSALWYAHGLFRDYNTPTSD